MSTKDTKTQSEQQHEKAVYNVHSDDNSVVSVVATSLNEAVKLAKELSKEESKQ